MPLGIDNLKKLVKASLDMSEAIADALKDGKISTMELVGFFDELIQIPGVVKSWPNIVAELKDLTSEERLELHAFAVEEFDIPNDKVEKFVENALLQAVSLISLVEEFKALKSAA